MGKGLIPADPETWSRRRRQIVPAFHKAWLEHMVGLFGYCNKPLITSLSGIAAKGGKVEMEEKFCSVALDIIGKSVFNYDFGSVTEESPVIKAVYSALVEAEHRSMTPAPYWDLPFANEVVPRLRKFNSDLRLLNGVLDDLIDRAKNTRQVEDIEELEKRNYENVEDPSLLRFLVDMRGADIDNKQLRDDLMTMLIAGHETTAAVLTWALFELTKNPECMAKAREEIDRVVGDRTPTLQDVKDMKYLRLVVAETLRLYPEPPLLIRRSREDNELPKGGGREATVIRGMDIFISLYNIHRDGRFWPEPDLFDPDRFTRPYSNPDVPEWKGYDPAKWENNLYPNEVASDFAYLPFGGGARKCVGDEFATKNPECMAKAREEIDRVVGDRTPTLQDVKDMKYLRLVVAETLRLYPEPPLLIRRSREDNELPKGGGREATVIRGMDIFISLYNIHRDGRFWPEPDLFDPDRFTRPYSNPDVPEWKGYDPAKWENNLYPNEVASDFAYLPFGGGARKCVGDEFATLEATVTLAMVLRRFDFDFDPEFKTNVDMMEHPMDLEHPVGMRTGATIHTRKGLHMIVKERKAE